MCEARVRKEVDSGRQFFELVNEYYGGLGPFARK